MGTTNVDAALPSALATPERLACLEKAQAVRAARESLANDVAAHRLMIDAVLIADDDADIVSTTKVLPLVEAVPHMGKVTSRRLLTRLSIEETAIVGDLASDEIAALLTGIEEHRHD